MARLRSAYGVQLAVSSLFERPTVAGVAERLRGLLAGEEREQAIVSRERSGPVQLSLAQRRLWVLERLNPGGASYNVPLVLRLRGPLDRELLARCLSELVARHEPLRTSFTTVDGEAVQCVAAPARIPLAVSDLRTLGTRARAQRLRALVEREARLPFDLTRAPLLRARLARLSEHEHVLMLTVHHLVIDGWSVPVLFGELSASTRRSRRDGRRHWRRWRSATATGRSGSSSRSRARLRASARIGSSSWRARRRCWSCRPIVRARRGSRPRAGW